MSVPKEYVLSASGGFLVLHVQTSIPEVVTSLMNRKNKFQFRTSWAAKVFPRLRFATIGLPFLSPSRARPVELHVFILSTPFAPFLSKNDVSSWHL